ncbi:hypothetical protein P7L78_09200 [Tistrella bauzanensis]|uniref:hypothetical protein n=1 Tax=Tistrella TaxID=171436 RepID=UPI0031F69E61
MTTNPRARPATGGSWVRDPITGALSRAGAANPPEPAPVPADVPAPKTEPVDVKKRGGAR